MMAVEAACEASYRKAAAELNDLTGLDIGPMSVWRIVQNAGSWEQAQVDALAAAAKAESRAGTYETPVLYEEMDGVYLALQGSVYFKLAQRISGVKDTANRRRRYCAVLP